MVNIEKDKENDRRVKDYEPEQEKSYEKPPEQYTPSLEAKFNADLKPSDDTDNDTDNSAAIETIFRSIELEGQISAHLFNFGSAVCMENDPYLTVTYYLEKNWNAFTNIPLDTDWLSLYDASVYAEYATLSKTIKQMIADELKVYGVVVTEKQPTSNNNERVSFSEMSDQWDYWPTAHYVVHKLKKDYEYIYILSFAVLCEDCEKEPRSEAVCPLGHMVYCKDCYKDALDGLIAGRCVRCLIRERGLDEAKLNQ